MMMRLAARRLALEGAEGTRGRPVSGVELVRTIVTWVVLASVAGVLTWGASQLAPAWRSANEPALLIVAEVYLSLPVAMLLNVGGWSGMRDRLGLRFTSWRDVCLAIAAWLVTIVVAVAAYVALTPLLGSPLHTLHTALQEGTDVRRLPTATAVDLALILVRAILLAALAEELLYRGLLFSWLRRRLPAAGAILVTAALFAAQHYYPAVVVLALLYGLASGWVRARTGSTLNTMVMHVLSDGTLLTLAVLGVTSR